MCVAVYKPINVEIPTREILKNCWTANDDGAGFAFAYEGKVHTKKGFMTFDSFMDAFNFNNKKYDFKKCGLLIHFRIATHGGRDASMTHPFPINSDEGALTKPDFISDFAIVHNGIIALTRDKASATTGLSDTALFVQGYLAPLAQNRGWFKRSCNIELIETLLGTSNKMAIINGKGEIVSTRGFTESDGIFYSNDSFKDTYYRYGSYHVKGKTYNTIDYDDDYYIKGYNWNQSKDPNVTSGGLSVISNETRSIGLMQAHTGETLEYDGVTQSIDSDSNEKFFVDEAGSVWITDDIPEVPDAQDIKSYSSYYLIGTRGKIYSTTANVREFKSDRWCFPKQFPEQ